MQTMYSMEKGDFSEKKRGGIQNMDREPTVSTNILVVDVCMCTYVGVWADQQSYESWTIASIK